MPIISIIVPVYNAEQYLPECVDSILHQNLSDIELILVDDGAQDQSPALCICVPRQESPGGSPEECRCGCGEEPWIGACTGNIHRICG